MSKASRQKQRLWLVIAFGFLIWGASHYQPYQQNVNKVDTASISSLYQQQKSDVLVEVKGTVSRILTDDNKGSRHQRFIITLPDKLTVLIAHNIDLAPRIDSLNMGDEVHIFGEYEWNDKGGVIHWTHHDPANKHPHGWIRHKGQLYQ